MCRKPKSVKRCKLNFKQIHRAEKLTQQNIAHTHGTSQCYTADERPSTRKTPGLPTPTQRLVSILCSSCFASGFQSINQSVKSTTVYLKVNHSLIFLLLLAKVYKDLHYVEVIFNKRQYSAVKTTGTYCISKIN